MLSSIEKFCRNYPLILVGIVLWAGIAVANLTSHTEALLDAVLLALDSDADGNITDETWYITFNSKESGTSNDFDPDRLAGDTTDDDLIDPDIVNITSIDIKYDASTSAGHPLNSDDTYSGMPLTGINAGESISQWDMVYYDTTATEWLIADADASGEAPAWGIAVSAGTDGNALDVLQKGFVRNDAWTWTPGAKLYLDDTTPGGLTETAPSTSTDIVQPVGVVYTADIIWINVDPVFNYTRVQ
jgi:hypothetical protein